MNFNFVSIPRTGSGTIHEVFNTGKFLNHSAYKDFPDKSKFSFAVIREPIDRLISWYYWCVNYDSSKELYPLTFEEWVFEGCKHHWSDIKCLYSGFKNPLNQYEFVSDGTVTTIDLLYDYIYLKELIGYIADKFGYKLNGVPKLHRSGKPDVVVTRKMRKAIQDMFPLDFSLYDKVHENRFVYKGHHI